MRRCYPLYPLGIKSWVARTERVTFADGVGRTGDVFSYTASTALYELSEYLREGDVLSSHPHVRVNSVLGYRVLLSSPATIKGQATFYCGDFDKWIKHSSALKNVTLSSVKPQEQINELLSKLSSLRTSVYPLSKTGGSPKEGTALDIKDGHYNVGANYAYNIIERGRFYEYAELTDTEASTSSLLSAAARIIKAGAFL